MVLVQLHNAAQPAAVDALIPHRTYPPLLQYNQPITQHISLPSIQLLAVLQQQERSRVSEQ